MAGPLPEPAALLLAWMLPRPVQLQAVAGRRLRACSVHLRQQAPDWGEDGVARGSGAFVGGQAILRADPPPLIQVQRHTQGPQWDQRCSSVAWVQLDRQAARSVDSAHHAHHCWLC